jgi:hypothetical protein
MAEMAFSVFCLSICFVGDKELSEQSSVDLDPFLARGGSSNFRFRGSERRRQITTGNPFNRIDRVTIMAKYLTSLFLVQHQSSK